MYLSRKFKLLRNLIPVFYFMIGLVVIIALLPFTNHQIPKPSMLAPAIAGTTHIESHLQKVHLQTDGAVKDSSGLNN